jgi:hypothetical protein
MLVMTGRRANLLARGTVSAPSSDPDFPPAFAFDNDPGTVYSTGSGIDTVEAFLEIDGDIGHGEGSFETAFVDGTPPGFVNDCLVDGELERDLTNFDDGEASCKFINPATPFSIAGFHRDYIARAGETLRVHFARLIGTDAQLSCWIQDLDTGQWLNDQFEWQDADTTFLVDIDDVPNEFIEFNQNIVVSPMSYWAKPIRRLRLSFEGGPTTASPSEVWVDSLFIVPAYDMMAVFGHSIKPAGTIEWIASDDPEFGTSTELAEFRPVEDKFYHRLGSPSTLRYQQIFVGFSVDVIYAGEIIIGAGYHFPRTAATPIQTSHEDRRIEVPRHLGGRFTRGLARSPRVSKILTFQFDDTPITAESGDWDEWHSEIFLRSMGGQPAVIVPTTDRAEVLFGHLSGSFSETDGAPGQAGYKVLEGFVVDELPFPIELPGPIIESA